MSTPYTLETAQAASGRWILARGPAEVTQHLARVEGARPWGESNVALPARRLNFLVAEAVGVPVEVSASYREWRRHCVSTDERLVSDVRRLLEKREEPALAELLLPHQLEFLGLTLRRSSLFNASEQGTGKTLMALAAAVLWRAERVLVLCPKEVAGEWQEALQGLSRPFCFLDLADGPVAGRLRELGRLTERTDAPRTLAVANYEALRALRPALAGWRPTLVVADESWKIKTPNAQRTRSALWLTSGARAAATPYRLCLAGTPVGNHVGDLWPQLRFLDPTLAPETYTAWLRRFAVLEPIRVGGGALVHKPVGLADPVELMRRLEPVWFRATKELCLRLPPKRRRVVELDLAPEVRALYRRVEREGDAALGAELALTPPAVRDLRLQQVAGGHRPHPEEAGWRGCEELPCAKLGWLRDWAGVALEPHPSVRAIVFCRFNAEVRRITAALQELLGAGAVAGVTGDGGPFPLRSADLDAAKASFNSRAPGGVRVIVAQVRKLAAGHNLQACDHVLYFSNDWSHVLREQSEDRAHRLGREGEVQYWDLVARGTVDADVLAALRDKRDFAGRVAPATAGG